MAVWIDPHVHLDFWRMQEIPGIIDAAQQAGVEKILTVSRTVFSSVSSVWIGHQFDSVVVGVGIHPGWPGLLDNEAYRRLKALTRDEKVVAIGETGLEVENDRGGSPAVQREKFARHIRLGRDTGLPLVIHNLRQSGKDIIEVFEKEKGMEVGGVLHSTMVDIKSAKPLWEMGVYISIGRQVKNPDFKYLEEVVKQVPEDKLMIETDSAGGGTLSHHTNDSTPAKIVEVAERVASIRGISVDRVREVSVRNICNLFRL